jgi:hypothetical protein
VGALADDAKGRREVTYKKRIEAYREYLATLPLSAGDRYRYLAAYSGHGAEPSHCWRCNRRADEAHAASCDAATANPIAALCDDCGRDLTDGPHYELCPKAPKPCGECGATLEDEPHAVTCSYADPAPMAWSLDEPMETE